MFSPCDIRHVSAELTPRQGEQQGRAESEHDDFASGDIKQEEPLKNPAMSSSSLWACHWSLNSTLLKCAA